jgi:hypothetical protein
VALLPAPQDDEQTLNQKLALFQLMQQPILSAYRVDIETDSTIRADVAKAKGEMGEFLNGTASYFQTMGPLLAQAPQAAEPVVEIYGAFASYFNLGKQAEDALERLVEMAREAGKQPAAQGPSPEQIAAEAEAQAKQAEMNAKQQAFDQDMARKAAEHDAKMQMLMADRAVKEADRAAQRDKFNAEMAMKRQEHEQAMAKLREDAAMARIEHEARLREMGAKMIAAEKQANAKAAQSAMKQEGN